MVQLHSLAQVFSQITDPRRQRGKRHPLAGMLSLVFLGLLARIREMAVLQRWAQAHWDQLQEPLGFDREQPPHATTFSRVLAQCSVAEFAEAFAEWTRQMLPEEPLTVAIDGKTSCQGIDDDGSPVQLVTAFVHDLKLVLAQWSVRGDKTNEPGVLKKRLPELAAKFPLLKLITGDAIYANRPLAEVLLDEGCDYLLQIKGNQKDVHEAAELCLGAAHDHPPAAQSLEKKGIPTFCASYGLT
jgi:hypothetical protein